MTEHDRDLLALAEDLDAQREQLAAERAAFRREQSTYRAEAQVREMAERMGFRRPEKAWRLIDHDALDIDPEGSGARNVLSPLEQLAAEEPYLLVPPRGNA